MVMEMITLQRLARSLLAKVLGRSFLWEMWPLAIGRGCNPLLSRALFSPLAHGCGLSGHHGRACSFVTQLQCLVWEGHRTVMLGICIFPGGARVRAVWVVVEARPGIAPSPFHLDPGLWTEDKQLCQNLLSGSETTQFSCLLKLRFGWHGPLGSKEKEMLWNMKVIEGNTLFIFPTLS